MKRLFTLALFTCIACSLAFAQSADEQTLLRLDQEFITAMLKNDVAALERLTDKDYQGFNQFGQNNKRDAFLTLYKTFQTTKLTTSNVKVHVTGDTALVSGQQVEASTSNFSRDQYLNFLHIWVRRADGWKLLVKQQQFDAREGTVTPHGWTGGSTAYFLVGTDTTVKRSGNASGFIKAKHNEDRPFGTGMSQEIKADAYRGKRIRLTGFTKGAMQYGYAFPWMRVETTDRELLNFDNQLAQAFFVRADWQRFAIVLDVPEKSEVITLGFQVNGRGHVWMDDWQLEVVGKDVPSTNQLSSEAILKMMEEFKTRNPAQYEQDIRDLKKRLPTLPAAFVNLDFETPGETAKQ